MKPYVICHMVASLDGRTLISRWRPTDASRRTQFAELHERLAVDAWLVGRVTGAEYAKASAYPALAGETYPREPWFARRDAAAYGVVLDAQGKIAWGRGDIDGDPIVVVLSEQVSDSHLAGLRRDGVSYLFAVCLRRVRRMHDPIPSQGQWLRQVATGFFAYYAVPTNVDALAAFRYHIMMLWMRTLTRRSQKDRTGWDRINRLADQWLPKPRILHPWPNQRFAVKHPRWEPDAGMPHVRFCAGGAQ